MSPDPSRYATPPITKYRVATTAEVKAAGVVNTRTEPCVRSDDTIVRGLKPGTQLEILCQARGQKVYGTSSVWDFLADETWLADYVVEGTMVNKFTPGIPTCTE